MTEWQTGAGQLVVLHGVGWPEPDSQCRLHEVDPPVEGERRIMTLRQTSAEQGPGAPSECAVGRRSRGSACEQLELSSVRRTEARHQVGGLSSTQRVIG